MADISETLAERGSRYGDFTDNAHTAQALQDVMHSHIRGWTNLDAVKRQALTVIADKIARILNGDPDYKDNWHDIAGYAKLAEDRCKERTTTSQDPGVEGPKGTDYSEEEAFRVLGIEKDVDL